MANMRNLTGAFNTRVTPQDRPIPGREKDMVENSAGGVTFQVDRWSRLLRFLILGSEGSYYASARTMTEQSAKCVLDCLAADGRRTVDLIADVSDAGRAPKNTPALFALAMCCKLAEDDQVKAYAYAALPRVARIPTHLFEWTEAVRAFGGYTKGFNRAVSRWYVDPRGDLRRLRAIDRLAGEERKAALREAKDLFEALGVVGRSHEVKLARALEEAERRSACRAALHAVKYQSRDGWTGGDLLRLAKPGASYSTARGRERRIGATRDGELDHVFGWMTGKWAPGENAAGDATDIIWAFERAKAVGLERDGKVHKDGVRELVGLIADHNLPRECIPTAYLNEAGVWEALLMAGHGMPLTAMIRNLPKMTVVGLLAPMSDATRYVRERLSDADALHKARIHPLNVLVALKTYQQGRGVRGSLSWAAVSQVVDALDGAFYKSFDAVEPTGKRWLLALDISGSMGAPCAGMPSVDCRTAAAAMAMVTARVEDDHHVVGFTCGAASRGGAFGGFGGVRGGPGDQNRWVAPRNQIRHTWGGDDGLTPLSVSPRQRLDDVMREIQRYPMGGTDCSLPMLYALDRKIPVDVFVVYTDAETWAGRIQPVQALRAYRDKMGIDAKLIVAGMVGNDFTLADPTDAGMLDVVGFDTSAPSVMAGFARGEF